jgi:8-oxo-dGTP pyrophosphatase MutT (NUDIX family)
VEPGEALLDAARRELAEALWLDVSSVGTVHVAIHDPGSDWAENPPANT